MKKYLFLLLLPVLAYAGRLQNEDFKTEAELTGAGGAVSQLLNDSKIYVTSGSINKTLDDAITDGDIGETSPTTTEGDIIVRGASEDERLAASAFVGYVLTNNGAGVKPSYQKPSPTTTTGDLIVRGAGIADERLASGTSGHILTSNGAGVKPTYQAPPVSTTLTTKGQIQGFSTVNANVGPCTNDQVLLFDTAEATGWKCSEFLSTSPTTTEGDIIVRGATEDERLAPGTAGQLLTSNGAGTAPSYQAAPVSTTLDTKGDLQGFSTVNAKLPVGADGQFIVADSSEALGVKYTDSLQGKLNPVTDGIAYTPTITGFSTVSSVNFEYWQEGERLHVEGTFVTSTPQAVIASLSLPSSLVMSDDIASDTVIGGAKKAVASTTLSDWTVVHRGTSDVLVYFGLANSAGVTPFDQALGSSLAGTGNKIQVKFDVKIVGWTSGLDAVVESKINPMMEGASNTGQTITANVTDIPFAETSDNRSAWDGDSYTVPVGEAGSYFINGGVSVTAGTAFEIRLYINSVFRHKISQNITTSKPNFKDVLYLNEGDVISVRSNITRTLASDTTNHFIHIQKLIGDDIIAAAIDSQKWDCETKHLTVGKSGTTGVMSDLTFTTEVDKQYYYNVRLRIQENTATVNSKECTVLAKHNGAEIDMVYAYGNTTARIRTTKKMNGMFKATSTSLTFDATNNTNTQILGGVSTLSWVQLCAIPDNYILN